MLQLTSSDKTSGMEVPKSDINILLLGETGVGKSTFINSFANYLQYETFEAAVESELLCLIPTKFTIPDENYKERYVEIGNDRNEDQHIGNSSTQAAKSYVFPIEGDADDRKIRLIDTPGIGDNRGMAQDDENIENTLDYISECEYLHGICFLLKPNVSILSAYFKFCLLHLLTRLEKSAVQNIIFIFTNTRTTFYRPGETLTILRQLLAQIQTKSQVKIPCDVENIFCMDNEAFRFLVAVKNGFKFSVHETENYSASWELSVQTCKKLVGYVAGITVKPHLIKNTLSINEARKVIMDLSKPLVDISDLIQDNLFLLERHEKNIARDGQSIEEFKKNLYVPVVHINKKELDRPVTVCTAARCSERIPVGENVMYHYKQRCHNPCYLDNVVRNHIGAKELLSCAAMEGTSCIECGCPFLTHMHIYYETEKVDAVEENESIKGRINTTEDRIKVQREYIEKLRNKRSEYEKEKNIITKSLAKFAYFLKENSISIFNDAYEEYLQYLISRENQLGPDSNQKYIDRHVALIKEYQQQKQLLETLLQNQTETGRNSAITATEINELVKELYALKHTGKKIEELHKAQQNMRSREYERNTEYFYNKIPSKFKMAKDKAMAVYSHIKGNFQGRKVKPFMSETASSFKAMESDMVVWSNNKGNFQDRKVKPSRSETSSSFKATEIDMVTIKSVLETDNLENLTTTLGNLSISEDLRKKLANMTLMEIIKFVSDYFEVN